ncbi:MAG: hypothetical protein MJB14_20075 [Spirochaetes bacterium]|nr:hypothetical protein [Spirochaetota bacterium]
MFIQAINWNTIIKTITEKKIFSGEVISIYLITNVAKYLPGNIFHFAGRHYILRKYIKSDIQLVLINLSEIGFFLLSSFLLFSIGIFSNIITIPADLADQVNIKIVVILSIVGIIVSAILFLIFNKKILNEFKRLLKFRTIKNICILILSYFSFFIITGLLYTSTVRFFFLVELSFIQYLFFICVYSFSWLLGFVVPGASGGLGVRESVLVLMISPFYGAEIALSSGIIFRIITISGEILTALYGKIIEQFFVKKVVE